MTYDDKNRDLLGLTKKGATRVNGPRTVHQTTEPLAHPGKTYEPDAREAGNVARSGSPKRLQDVAVHSGQHARTRDGALITGQTMTSLANAPDASGARPLDPTVDGCKHGKIVPPSPGMRSRSGEVTPMEPGAAHNASAAVSGFSHVARHINADRIIGEGLKNAGPDHPARLRGK